ncbi:MAG: PP2C family protein-serine/threonine phosphatase [Planctomycetota bacterium]
MQDTKALAAPQRMQCMEMRGGNRAIDKSFEAPGLDVYIYSTPYLDSDSGGGDIYYLTSCASGRVSRLLLADVSGHGKGASSLATSLRDLLRKNVNKISQQKFVQQMNSEFGSVAGDSGFATAVVATFFEPAGSLSLSVAGHPNPIYYRASTRRWVELAPEEYGSEGSRSLPLGVLKNSTYPDWKLKTEPGDKFLLYSDALIEATDSRGMMLGTRGVVDLLNESEISEAGEVIPYLRDRISSISGTNLREDDTTMILCEFSKTRVRFRDNLLAPIRLLGRIRDKTNC